MSLTLQPRAAPGDALRVWLGAFRRTAAPALTWELDGQAAAARTLRPLTSARRGVLLPDPTSPRAFTGVFELTGPTVTPGSPHTVTVRTADGQRASLRVRTLPDRVPAGPDARFNVLLVSCFHRLEDRRGFAGHVATSLPGPFRPHLTVLMGDQVYLDLPTLRNFRDDPAWLAAKFEDEDYRSNWAGGTGYGRLLGLAPSVFLPDDHEFWNNYPHPSPVVENTWREDGRRRWRGAAKALYEAFQMPEPEGLRKAVELDVAPLSFFFLDTRTFRDDRKTESTLPAVRRQLADWTKRVIARRRTAVVTTGQSLLDRRAGRLSGSVGDYTLPNYGDFAEIVEALAAVPRAGLPLLLLTGDVHWGRLASARDVAGSGRELVHEVIASPASLVSTVGADQLAGIGSALRGVFGRRDPWPRHGDPAEAPAYVAPEVLGSRFPVRTRFPLKGNQIATLSFQSTGFGVEVDIRYWPVEESWGAPRPKHAGVLRLQPA